MGPGCRRGSRLTLVAELADLAEGLGSAPLLAALAGELADATVPDGAALLDDLAPRLARLGRGPVGSDPAGSVAGRREVRRLLRTAGSAAGPAGPHRPDPGPFGPGLFGPGLLGTVREALLGAAERRRGAHYTPGDVAAGLVAEVLDAPEGAPLVADPALGCGAFLLAAADVLAAAGLVPAEIVGHHLWGVDADELSVAVAEASLVLWSLAQGAAVTPGDHLVGGEGLAPAPRTWEHPPSGGFDVVVGNPPFQGQLTRRGARRPGPGSVPSHLEPFRSAYTDTAALFLAHAVTLVRPGGRVGLIQPLSVLSSRDAAAVRTGVSDEADLVGLWVPGERVFGAAVDVCAPVLERRRPPPPIDTVARGSRRRPAGIVVRRTTGRRARLVDEVRIEEPGPRWSELAAPLLGVPPLQLAERSGTVGDLATATAGFRDQFYGLVPHVREARAGPGVERATGELALVTAGLVDPVNCRWGRAGTRFAGRRWTRPVVPTASLCDAPEELSRWVLARARPKLLVATQTRVVEVLVDPRGELVPSVPVIAVHAPADELWRLAAAISSPVATAWALARTLGAARAGDALKLAARQVLDIPLPSNAGGWERACGQLRSAAAAAAAGDAEGWSLHLRRFGAEAMGAYDLAADDPLLSWWLDRLPGWR